MQPPNHRHVLEAISKRPSETTRYVEAADEGVIRAIDRGVLFLFVPWSGSCLLALEKVSKILARPHFDHLEFVIVDLDTSPRIYELPELQGRVHGHGETACIRNGIITYLTGRELSIRELEAALLTLAPT